MRTQTGWGWGVGGWHLASSQASGLLACALNAPERFNCNWLSISPPAFPPSLFPHLHPAKASGSSSVWSRVEAAWTARLQGNVWAPIRPPAPLAAAQNGRASHCSAEQCGFVCCRGCCGGGGGSPSGSGWDPRDETWIGRYGLPSEMGTSTLSSDDTVTSGCDSEMDDRNWSMSAFCSWSSSSAERGRTRWEGAHAADSSSFC